MAYTFYLKLLNFNVIGDVHFLQKSAMAGVGMAHMNVHFNYHPADGVLEINTGLSVVPTAENKDIWKKVKTLGSSDL